MTKEEIKEYLKRVDELELKLLDEDKDTLQWLIFGYNECARLLYETEQENQQLKEDNFKLQARADKYKCRIDKAIEHIKIYRSYEEIGGKDYLKNRDEIGSLSLLQVDKLLEKLGDNNEC